MKPVAPTDPIAEQVQGRAALWLDRSDLEWLSQFCGCADDATEDVRERCARIRFRASAALHKAGMKRPIEDES
ncbi:hypothetical protein FHR20_001327 [Sphingomonas leidyi]|uniref:Uncharacterized protein n=1 Tax=Sphingomonas leidyi TaxID=68569 RepID=A0A7X5UZ61_9SPHN|nr:hypothetical protein [Sphingomonas leidyi]NIJ64396.1 hypothetical protein [Sphingomonas leidyi]